MSYLRVRLIIYSLALSMINTYAIASEWRLVSKSEQGDNYIDVESMLTEGEIRRFWIKTILKEKTTFYGKDLKYFQRYIDIDCSKRALGLITNTGYDNLGSVVFSFTEEFVKHEPIAPDSLGEQYFRLVCSSRKKEEIQENIRKWPLQGYSDIGATPKTSASKANWIFITTLSSESEGRNSVYIDANSIKVEGNIRKFWEKDIYEKKQELEPGANYNTVLRYNYIDCSKKTEAFLQVLYYALNGTILHSYTVNELEYSSPFEPNMPGYPIIEFVCNYVP